MMVKVFFIFCYIFLGLASGMGFGGENLGQMERTRRRMVEDSIKAHERNRRMLVKEGKHPEIEAVSYKQKKEKMEASMPEDIDTEEPANTRTGSVFFRPSFLIPYSP
mmetsp:Transcript_9754/g.15018  ORF Transcript_9754/g.15018 Transcript_9754/m.15018 type:complete len:107 (+) Transcript_9754:76-396(+)